MASFWCTGKEFYAILGEIGGYKAGLGLTPDAIESHLTSQGSTPPPFGAPALRIRHEELEEYVRELLLAVGALRTRHSSFPSLALCKKYGEDEEALAILRKITDTMVACSRVDSAGQGPINLTPMFVRAAEDHGARGFKIAQEFYELLEDHMQGSILASFRRTEWKDIADLQDLFDSEDVQPSHGTYIDQRYIDYLEKNFDRIDAMNWRKFEGLTAEFFDRQGYRVELGPGRNDGGIDVRVWGDDDGTPPVLLVQCKRQKTKVGKVVVKALWADVLHEKAESGLIVTTSALEPGAAKLTIARSYPIRPVERENLRRWLTDLRTPGTGVPLV